ncbi:hypothetical protein [Gibbsiella quercinecans]|uniref:hypothetical protein n=1 Tax=Gibbsiella quercinecans TaxID=929813 RepID=UPI0016007CD3|nr:hypothetical protein [Gibbsiella quercinecans]
MALYLPAIRKAWRKNGDNVNNSRLRFTNCTHEIQKATEFPFNGFIWMFSIAGAAYGY